jgi:hypothetical protein
VRNLSANIPKPLPHHSSQAPTEPSEMPFRDALPYHFFDLARILSRPKDFNTRSEDYSNRRTLLSFSTHDADRATKVEERRPGM